MKFQLNQKFKSLSPFLWDGIPKFVVLTGPNGIGKSQLLTAIYGHFAGGIYFLQRNQQVPSTSIQDVDFKAHEVSLIQGEWQLGNVTNVSLSGIQQKRNAYFSNAQQFNNQNHHQPDVQGKFQYAVADMLKKTGKTHQGELTLDEYVKFFPAVAIESDQQMGQVIAEIFYEYRLDEIELQAKGLAKEEILSKLGQQPWVVLRQILEEAKLGFEITDPSESGFRDQFALEVLNSATKEKVNLGDLSSGEKVLMSLIFILYNSRHGRVLQKLLILDEPDAHLHPAMSKQFIDVIKNVLVDKLGVRVIMSTHSPSTVMLAPEESIFEMSKNPTSIVRATKNHAASLLTSGLVFVGEGTRYFLVEDRDDVEFYSFLFNYLTSEKIISSDIPLVFIAASTKDNSGGKSVVQNWVEKLASSGMDKIIGGLIDEDSGNDVSLGVHKIMRYSIENYLSDPILVYIAMMDREQNFAINKFNFKIGDEMSLINLRDEDLQEVADAVIEKVIKHLPIAFPDIAEDETRLVNVGFVNGKVLLYPKWVLNRKGKDLINKVFGLEFTNSTINFFTLSKALRRTGFVSSDFVAIFSKLREG